MSGTKMEQEYIIISKTAIQRRIEELEKAQKENPFTQAIWAFAKEELQKTLSQSTPLIPEIEKAFDTGRWGAYATGEEVHSAEEYSLNLKLNI